MGMRVGGREGEGMGGDGVGHGEGGGGQHRYKYAPEFDLCDETDDQS